MSFLLTRPGPVLDDDRYPGEYEHIFGLATDLAGSPNDLFYLAEQLALGTGPRPALFQWCGTEDILYEGNVRFHEHLQALGLAVTYSAQPGTHEWAYWDQQIQRVLAWLPGLDQA